MGNSAGDAGGAAHFAGEAYIYNVVLSGNSADYGGAIALNEAYDGASLDAAHSTFSGNSAAFDGGAIYGRPGDKAPAHQVRNSVFWSNTAGGDGSQFYEAGTGQITVQASLVEGGISAMGLVDGGGNIDADPLFTNAPGADGMVGTLDDDLVLSEASPAIDSADNTLVPPDVRDLDGDSDFTEPLPLDRNMSNRRLNGGRNGVTADMGAYEFIPSGYISHALSVQGEWNLIGLPLDPPDAAAQVLFEDHIPQSIYTYEGGYTQHTTLDMHRGYWMKMPAPSVVPVIGASMVDDASVSLSANWNMISGLSCESAITDPSNIIIPGTLFSYEGSYAPATTLSPGRGYWVRTTQAGEIMLTCTVTTSSKRHQLAQAAPEGGFGKLDIATPQGQATLWFGGELSPSADARSYSLPPPSPNGNKAVRFRVPVGSEYVAMWLSDQLSDRRAWQGINRIAIEGLQTASHIRVGYAPASRSESYALEIVLADGTEQRYPLSSGASIAPVVPIHEAWLVKAADEFEVPQKNALFGNYPNPFNGQTMIKFALEHRMAVTLVVYDLIGREVKQLAIGKMFEAGVHSVALEGSGLSSGVYVYQLQAGEFVASKRMTLVR
ncbi:MAG: hypothetical protein RhofKO_32900 [Rhodothermales bacterium]